MFAVVKICHKQPMCLIKGNGPTDEHAVMIVVLEANFDLKFGLSIEMWNLNYPGIHVHVASNSHFGGL